MSGSRKNGEVRGGWQSWFIGMIGGSLLRLLNDSLQIRMRNNTGLDFRVAPPVIYAIWHDQILAATVMMQTGFWGRGNCVLTSASRDGGILSGAAAMMGMKAARGSSSRRGAAALVALRRALRDGLDVTITPDGPRGPRHRARGGIIHLASVTGAPIVPVRVKYGAGWQLSSWDKMSVPKPGSDVFIDLGRLLEVGAKLDEAGLLRATSDLEKRLQFDVES